MNINLSTKWKNLRSNGTPSLPSQASLGITSQAQRREKIFLYLKFTLAVLLSNLLVLSMHDFFSETPVQNNAIVELPFVPNDYHLIEIPIDLKIAPSELSHWVAVDLWDRSKQILIEKCFINISTCKSNNDKWQVDVESGTPKKSEVMTYLVAIPKPDLSTILRVQNATWLAIPQLEQHEKDELIKSTAITEKKGSSQYEVFY